MFHVPRSCLSASEPVVSDTALKIHENVVELPKLSNLGVCNVALKDAQVLSGDSDAAESSLHEQRRDITLHIGKKAKTRRAPYVRVYELQVPNLEKEKTQRDTKGFRDFEHMQHPEQNEL